MSAYVCPTCKVRPIGRYDQECTACIARRSFAVTPTPQCASCEVEPVDPMWAPACSSTCREAWEIAQRLAKLRADRDLAAQMPPGPGAA